MSEISSCAVTREDRKSFQDLNSVVSAPRCAILVYIQRMNEI